ncbi:YrvL family regulatory protein [Lentibacillus juripiscarius]|uniref:YrvL family regulatory protein n=1 Tax=Lentibacillus juripiscarius TaxID=257446 RepID=A0ABW5V3T7_9BACI
MSKEDESFRYLKLRQKIIVVLALTLVVSIAIAIVFGGFFFGLTGFFSLIGVTYESTGTLLLFVLYCFLIGIIFEVIEKIVLVFIVKANIRQSEKFLWTVFVKFGLTWVVIYTVDELMGTITLSGFAEFLTALLIVSIDMIFDDEKRNNEKK